MARSTRRVAGARARAIVLPMVLAAAAPATGGAALWTFEAVLESSFLLPARTDAAVHAPTVVATDGGLVAAWYEGTAEGRADVAIRVARRRAGVWSEGSLVATGRDAAGREEPTWNPVLFQPSGGPLLLFYKVGGSPMSWRGAARISTDDGESWSDEILLPEGRIGPSRVKPLQLPDGSLLIGSSTESLGGWRVHLERFSPHGPPERGLYSLWEEPVGEPVLHGGWDARTLAAPGAWLRTRSLASRDRLDAIQPTLLDLPGRRLLLLARTRSGFVAASESGDGGDTWSLLRRTPLDNPDAGIDAVGLADGRFLLVHNPVRSGRSRLGVSVSPDGELWRYVLELENATGEYSYPAAVQAPDGRVHVVYTWRRERIRHVVLDPAYLR